MFLRRPIILLLASCIIVSVYYNYYEYTFALYIPIFIEKKPIYTYYYNGTEDFLINTTGCLIPNYIKTFDLREYHNEHRSCGERAVFVSRKNDDIIFEIDENILNRVYNKKNYSYQCCYSIVKRSEKEGSEDKKIDYSECETFTNNYKMPHKNEIYTVKCTTQSSIRAKPAVIYDDAYLILKKQVTKEKHQNKWNFIVIGIDTLSRARLLRSLPKTAEYLQRHGWLDFRGFQKVGYNTFPNLGAILTGQSVHTIYKECAKGMHTCNHLMIWSLFRKAGYKTAYSEDNLALPDTFSRFNGFKVVPTDHYTKPFYLTKEKPIGNFICTKKLSSTEHMLNYAYDFVDAYKHDSFFGVFWINTISHNLNYLPGLHDNNIVNFLENINSTGALRNTFVIFASDHGIRFGNSRNTIESYYAERLPMLYIWTPIDFRQQYSIEYYNLQVNQNRLITPYDLHLTFQNILALENITIYNTTAACKSCTSLIQEIPENRTCADVGVNACWCSCRTLVPIDRYDIGATTSLQLAISYISNKAIETKTIACMKCAPLKLDSVLRTHTFKESNKNIYVVAFKMKPIGMNYEATVAEENGKYELVDNIYSISSYNNRGSCTKNPYDRAYCLCQKDNSFKCKRKHG